MVSSLKQMTAYAKEIPNDAAYRQESLRVSRGFEPSHVTFALASWLMRDFGSVVLVLRSAIGDRGHQAGVGRRIAAKLVGDQTSWRMALPFQ